MKRTTPSPKRGLCGQDPRQLNLQISDLCPVFINVSPASASSMIEKINSERADRHLAFQNIGDQLELLRLEALRLKLLESTKAKSSPENEMPPQRATPVSTEDLSSNGEPGPTVPNSRRSSMRSSMRPRAAVLSETQPSRRNSSSSNAHTRTGLARTTAPSFVPGPSSDTSDQQIERHLRTDELESVALTSASGSVNNEFPLNLRQRRQNRTNINLPSPQELRLNRVNRAFSLSGPHSARGGSPNSFSDEPIRRIFSLSVPQSPQSPALPPHPILRRAQSSFNGMDPAFSAMRNAERAKQNAPDAAGPRSADRK
ncbi:unnamed protein product [Penicillium viridicatum]